MYKKAMTGFAALCFSLFGFSQLLMAEDISPQVGTWAIDEENNGKPGRGFQLDVQNDILVLYFYGYENTGESTYWLAAGRIPNGSNQLTAELGEYEGGMAFGDPIKNATYLGSRGNVTIKFTKTSKGEICLPGESCKAITAFNFGFENSASELLGAWVVTDIDAETSELSAYEFDFSQVVSTSNPNIIDRAVGSTNLGGVQVQIACDKLTNPQPWKYFCKAGALGESVEMNWNLQRNAFVGQYYDSLGTKVQGYLYGFRIQNPSGRWVIPN